MKRRQSLPLVLPVLILVLVLVGGCAAGSGLRVEGVQTPETSAGSPSGSPAGSPSVPASESLSAPASPSPDPDVVPKVAPSDRPGARVPAINLQAVRQTLLADPRVDPNFRTVLVKCAVVERCLRRGISADVMHTGRPQQVVTLHTLDDFSYGAFLLAQEPKGPRLIWSLRADQVTISRSNDGDLVVESKVFGIDDHACCPSASKVEVYRWNGQQMTRISEQQQGE